MHHRLTLTAALLAAALALPAAAFGQFPNKDTYEATTAGMSPEGLTLRIDVLEWSDDDARAAVVRELTGDAENLSKALAELPTVGAVWRDGSAVGHALKYAHRTETESGETLITVITDKPLDAYSFEKWTLAGETQARDRRYSVIELRVPENGAGTGTFSLAADVELDAEASIVRLARDETTPTLLTGVELQPKPYWAREN